jgi:hypothetical protein
MLLITKILPLQRFLLHHHLGRYHARIRQRPLPLCIHHPTPPMSCSLPIRTRSHPCTVQNYLRNLDQQATYLRPVQKPREPAYSTVTNHRIPLTWNPSPASLLSRYRRILRERNSMTVQSLRMIYQRTGLAYPEESGDNLISYVSNAKRCFNGATANMCLGLHWTTF